jgi:hypothetical protein
MVLDVGQSTRDRFNLFEQGKIETTNVNLDHRPADIIETCCSPAVTCCYTCLSCSATTHRGI